MDLCTHRKTNHTQASKIVQYFISAEEIEWDYSEERVWELEKHHATLEDRCAGGGGDRRSAVCFRRYCGL